MKPFALTLALIATVSALAQTRPGPDPAPATAKPALPAGAVEQLNATRPKFTPAPEVKPLTTFAPAPAAAGNIRDQSVARAPADELAPTEPEVLELPKMTVKQQPKPRPRLGASDTRAVMLGPKAFNEELARKNSGGLDTGLLNKFTLPSWMGGVSAAERAREDHNIEQKRQFLDDVLTISKAAEQADPTNAQSLREAAGKP